MFNRPPFLIGGIEVLKVEEFEKMISLRNNGNTQEKIAEKIGHSRRTVIRYLKKGKMPKYKKRVKPTKTDPFLKFKERAEKLLKDGVNGKIPKCSYIYQTIKKEGYRGSVTTVKRKTRDLRRKLKSSGEIFFEQEVSYGIMMEGDFTTYLVPFVSGEEKRHLWVTSLKKSKGVCVKSFLNETFESFAEGTSFSFSSFGGVPKIYRLDNLSPAVKEILRNGRNTTHKFNQLREHYNFEQSFCTPGKGNEKGTVESLNRHFKDYLSYGIKTDNKTFIDDDEFDQYLSLKVEEYNRQKEKEIEIEKKHLFPLPSSPFPSYTIEINTVNKYGFVRAASKRYSVTAEYKYCKVEMRIYSKYVEIYYDNKLIQKHKRATDGGDSKPTIDFRDHVFAMLKKPGAFTFYKHREAFFPTDKFREFYNKYADNKNYLSILSLCKDYSISEVEIAIDLVLSESCYPSYDVISSLVKPREIKYEYDSLLPLTFSLDHYDSLFLTHQNDSLPSVNLYPDKPNSTSVENVDDFNIDFNNEKKGDEKWMLN